MTELQLLALVDKVGTVGLAFMVWALMTGRLITRRELDREIERGNNLERRLDKALEYGERALGAGEKISQKLDK